MDRSHWPVKKYRLGEEPPDAKPKSVEEAWDWMWQIALNVWPFVSAWPSPEGTSRAESRLQRDVVHIVRGGR